MITKNGVIRHEIERNTLFATRYFFARENGRKFVVSEHHVVLGRLFDDIFAGKVRNVMINMPPRYSKTQFTKAFVEKGLGINPASKYLMLSYSDNLALDNSNEIRKVVSSEWYRDLYPNVVIARDTDSKKQWNTTQGGGVYATSSCGQVTGFGAGLVDTETIDLESFLDGVTKESNDNGTGWGGAIIIDDPMKASDAFSPVSRQKVVDVFNNTIRSRVNDRRTPIIIIMQRLHPDDLCGWLQKNEPEDWCVVSLPAIMDEGTPDERALYPQKHTLDELKEMRRKNPFVFDAQYMQDPKTTAEKAWLHTFDRRRHVGKTTFNPRFPLYASFDFNRNPMTCSLWQHYGGRVFGIDAIRIENSTTRMVCQEIAKRYPRAMLIVTGDCAGSNATTMSLMNNYDAIKYYFRLSDTAMQYSNKNPRLADSWLFMNACFEECNIMLDEDRCAPLIYDLENVKSDAERKPIKSNRDDPTQQADFLDNTRYYFHQFYHEFKPL